VDSRVNQFVRGEVKRTVGRFSSRLTRIEIHLSDVNSRSKAGRPDKRSMVEARPAGHRPLAVTMTAANVRSAVQGSLAKMRNALETFFGRMSRYRTKTARNGFALPSPRTLGKRVVALRPPARRTEGAALSQNGSAAAPTKAARRRGAKSVANGRGPKRKAIYQARRKSWPKR
jgi:hypothetical protein